ncbi:MAG: hypothetical protein ACOC1O_02080 [bacterium]
MSLKNVYIKLENIAAHSSTKEKEYLIKKYVSEDKLFKLVAYYALHPFKKYNTTQVFFLEDEKDGKRDIKNLFKMLEYLSKKRGANNREIEYLSYLASFDEDSVEVVKRIVNKDLRCGASLKTFRKAMPEIPEYSVMLCDKDIEKFFENCNNDLSQMRFSIKLDGVRCTANNGIYLSRNGKEFPNLQNAFDDEYYKLKNEILKLYPELNNQNIIIDGEVISNSSEFEFQDLMTQIRRLKDADVSNLSFAVFDIILENKTFEERYNILFNAFENIELKKLNLLVHPLCKEYFKTLNDIVSYSDYICSLGNEGIVLKNINSSYERKRSKQWCKIKRDETIDCRVTGWEYGKGKNSNVIGALICTMKDGKEFRVSGMDDKSRVDFMTNTPNIIEIEFQGLSRDGIPRFPRFKRVRDDKDEID